MCYTMGFGSFGNTFGWGGWGGSLVASDPGARMTVAYVMNQMIGQGRRDDSRGLEIVLAAYDGLRLTGRGGSSSLNIMSIIGIPREPRRSAGQRSSWIRISLPAGSRKAQSRTP